MNNNVEFGADSVPTRVMVNKEPSAMIKLIMKFGVSSVEKANMILLAVSVVFIIITIIIYSNIFGPKKSKGLTPEQVQAMNQRMVPPVESR